MILTNASERSDVLYTMMQPGLEPPPHVDGPTLMNDGNCTHDFLQSHL